MLYSGFILILKKNKPSQSPNKREHRKQWHPPLGAVKSSLFCHIGVCFLFLSPALGIELRPPAC